MYGGCDVVGETWGDLQHQLFGGDLRLINRNLMDPLKVFRSSMDRGPLNYDTWGIIKRRICVENVPGVELLRLIK